MQRLRAKWLILSGSVICVICLCVQGLYETSKETWKVKVFLRQTDVIAAAPHLLCRQLHLKQLNNKRKHIYDRTLTENPHKCVYAGPKTAKIRPYKLVWQPLTFNSINFYDNSTLLGTSPPIYT